MFGAYQAGVWDAISPFFQPDLVVGASVGSLNGWRIAGGANGADLVDQWSHLASVANIRWRFPRRPTEGILDTSALEHTIRDMCANQPPRVEFGVVLTRIPHMRPVLFRSPDVTWRHIAASCSVPLFLTQHRIDGNFYSDGGLVDPLPLQAAIAMGARRIVCVNLLKHRPWPVRASVKALRALAGYAPPDRNSLNIIEISPSQSLGSANDSMRWSQSSTARWIEAGRRDSETALPDLVKWRDRDWQSTPGENGTACPSTESIV